MEDIMPPPGFFSDYADALRMLQEESDRGVVLVVTGFFEQQLIDVLRSYLHEDRVSESLCSGGNAPLGTFSARIDMVYALGLIDKVIRDDLHLMRRVRNAFAHDWSVGFADRRVIDRCAALHNSVQPTSTFEEAAIGPRDQFVSTAAMLMVVLALKNRIAQKYKLTELPNE